MQIFLFCAILFTECTEKGGIFTLQKEFAALFAAEGIADTAALPLSECHVTLARLYEAVPGFAPQSVILFLMPYYAGTPENFSAYAAAEDYHLFIRALGERILPAMEKLLPGHMFRIYTDHSPIDERHAAVRAGLGVYGKNGLLLTEKYSSFQFIGEILTDAPAEALGEVALFPLTGCEGCGACLAACPTGILRGEGKDCLSAVTQKKGTLTEEEIALIKRCGTVWGCDACQNVCPYTRRAKEKGTIYSTIPFFKENRVEKLDAETLAALDDTAFSRRAFGWRGRAVVERNVAIFADKSKKTE